MQLTPKEIRTRFEYHPPDKAKKEKHELLRKRLTSTARLIVKTTPTSREQSLALTKLEEVLFWSNAAIARRDGVPF